MIDQECKNISHSRALKHRTEIFLSSEACKMAKKNMGHAAIVITTQVALLKNYVGDQLGL
jgi:hypothetical protein